MNPAATRVDRAALVRRALLELVAQHGFRGTSMAAVAERAGVATGTAYVHYRSKDELVIAAYVEQKAALGRAGAAAVDPNDAPRDRFLRLWQAVYDHLSADPDRARFLVQVDSSPYATDAHAAALSDPDDELMRIAAVDDLVELLVDLPLEVLYDLGLGPAVRLAATRDRLDEDALRTVAEACWRAITSG